MESEDEALGLYGTLYSWLWAMPWRDVRHLMTLCWMIVGLINSRHVTLTKWIPYISSRAELAQSTQRRFERWLSNRRISVLHLYGALLKQVLSDFQDTHLYLAMDTTMLWDTFCVVYISLVYRGRTIPLVWKVMKHKSASVGFRDYRSLLVFLQRQLPTFDIYLLADRGFVHRELICWVKKTPRWHFRIRYKTGVGLYQWWKGRFRKLAWHVNPGQVVYYYNVYVTGEHEAVHLAVGWDRGAKEPWVILSDEPTGPETLREYGLRFNIEEGFLDQKSNGFQWESSRLRNRFALQRLCFVMAVATLALICQGSAVVTEGRRRVIDPHWYRGHSYARIGWDWIQRALARGQALMPQLMLVTADDPERARASKRQPDRSRWMYGIPWRCCSLSLAPPTVQGNA